MGDCAVPGGLGGDLGWGGELMDELDGGGVGEAVTTTCVAVGVEVV